MLANNKYIKLSLVSLVLAAGIALLIGPQTAHALTPFNYTNYLMTDAVFISPNTMNAAQIQNFLQTEGSGLATFSDVENCGSSSGTNYSYYEQYYSCGSSELASTIIYNAAQAYGINPQVILATMQKEQSLVTTPNPTSSQLNCAMGYLSCSGDTGFFNQVDNATWQFRFDYERLIGDNSWWNPALNYPCGVATEYYSTGLIRGNNVTFYDEYGDAYANFTLPDASTASLYCYTPHVYPGSSRQYYSGSYNFVYYFNLWFVPFADTYYSQSAYPTVSSGQSATVWIEYQNNGYETWYDDDSISSAPAGTDPVHLATDDTLNRLSAFDDGWLAPDRPATTFAAVYDSDGVTLAPNQHEVMPGEIVKFSFNVLPTASLPPGTYPEAFVPVVEDAPVWTLNDPGTHLNITVGPVPNVSWVSQSNYPTVVPGIASSAYVMLSNTGNVPLYDDDSISSAPAGTDPVHLATSNPLNSSSAFSAGWPTTNRAANTFAAVYDSDGVTLAPNQHIAQPGQIVEFTFNFTPPDGYAAGTYQQYLQPILEGTINGYFSNLGISWTITVPSTAVIALTNSPSVSMISNQPNQITLVLENVGNASTSDNVVLTTTTGSQFEAANWVSNNNVESLGQSLTPGASMNLNVSLLAPTTGTSISTYFNAIFNDSGTVLPSINSNVLATIVGVDYAATYFSQSSYPSLALNNLASVYFMYENTGNQPWYDDDSLSSATWRDAMPTHLATANALNRSSAFDDGWPTTNRAANTFAAVYDSDGVTLAPNQHIAQPGQIVEFKFNITPASWLHAGVYPEYFQPIIEGTPNGAINYVGTSQNITVEPSTYIASYYAQSNYPTLSPGQQATVWFEYQNDGNQTWYDDSSISSAPVGTYPVHLATSRLLNRASAFDDGWPALDRPDTTFTAVYNSDGFTQSANQHIVQPGQIVKFSFIMEAPYNLAPGTYPEYFMPVTEGSSPVYFSDQGTAQDVTVN